jgi:hypothetical protein
MGMKSKWPRFLFCSVFLSLATTAQSELSNSPVYDFLSKGEVDASVGLAVNYKSLRNTSEAKPGLAWALADLGYTSPELLGLSAGIHAVIVNELWENHPNNYSETFADELDIRDLYLQLALPNTQTVLAAGRKKIAKTPVMRGDSHQGVELIIRDIPFTTLSLGALNRWIKHSTTFLDALGITGWRDVDDVNEDASDIFYTAMGTISIPKGPSLTPFINHQQHVMTVYGSSASVPLLTTDAFSWSVDAIGAYYVNEVPEALQPNYEDVQEYLLHTSISKANNYIGFGWWAVSDNVGATGQGMFSSFDPMEEDDLMPYDDQNNASEFYIDGHAERAPFSIDFVIAYGKNKNLDSYSREIDCFIYYDITPHMQLGVYVAWADYETDIIPSYTQTGSSLTLNF